MNDYANDISRTTVLKIFATLVVVAVFLRIFYAGHLFEDDGLWFTAAAELLRGKALYREIYFDKPPALPLLYALLFKLFGAHILTIRLFAAIYSVAVAWILYLFGGLLYDKRAGWFAASLFVVGSTTYTTGQFHGFNTDYMMTLPYTLGAYWFVRSRLASQWPKTKSAWLALAAGLAAGLALQTNPKALFDLLFFMLCALLLSKNQEPEVRSQENRSQPANQPSPDAGSENQPLAHSTPGPEDNLKSKIQNLKLERLPAGYSLLLALCGCLVGASPFWIYIAATYSWKAYWLSVWEWGARYASYYSWKVALTTALAQSLGYFLLNIIFLIGLLLVIITTARSIWQKMYKGAQTALVADSESRRCFYSDLVLLLWFAVSYAGMSVGGRFFGHYFFQILPALCLLAARAITRLLAESKASRARRKLIYAVLAMAVFFTAVRYHTRTAVLAADWLSGAKSEMTRNWFYERVQHEDQRAAAVVKEGVDSLEATERGGAEAARHGESGNQQNPEGVDYLFVWGYRPELYYWSGLQPASRYLSTQLLTGVPADVNYFGDDFTAVLDEKMTAAHRLQLLKDLQEKRPKFIIDELAAYNSALAMDSYSELRDFLSDYKLMETDVKVFIYRLRNPKEKNKPLASN